MSNLFRKEVFNNKNNNWLGESLLIQPLSFYLITTVLVVVVGAALTYLICGEYTRKEHVSGYLAPDKGVIKIIPVQPGFYSKILVENGDVVDRGSPVALVNAQYTTDGGENVELLLLKELQLEQANIDGRIALEFKRLDGETQRLASRVEGVERELEQLRQQESLQSKRLVLAQQLRKSYQDLLNKNFISDIEYEEQYEKVLNYEQEQSAFARQIIVKSNELTKTHHELKLLPLSTEERVAALESEKSNLRRRITEISGRESYILTAPAKGRIATLRMSEGQITTPGEVMADLLPEGALLQAHLYVPSRAIGFITRGLTVNVQYQAFPYQHFGTYLGRVVDISDTILSPTELSVELPIKEPVYKVVVELDSQQVRAYGEVLGLQVGMLLSADISVDTRSLMDWLLDPLYRLKERLL
ncbi:MAG: HlyD family efflux transporter periplasmic adaptor subunit [Gammaproteobacteria bacterium]|nr:HlyD family efflux transporter periplasmic adaptor subunit [Gammaproteobacteria bacterium]MBQ0840882.1 HlyD family efflux transporter periplasmic adaptor subunit [Gammaproteobacteria bacterium]